MLADNEQVVIVSSREVFCKGLKLMIEEQELARVTTVADEGSAADVVAKLVPGIVIVDRPDTKAVDLDYFFQRGDHPVKVVVIGWDNNQMAVYSRQMVEEATLQNLLEVIREERA